MKISRSHQRTTLWHLCFHFIAFGLAMISGIVLVPLYLKFIPLPLYGAWLATGNMLFWVAMVDPGLSGAVQQQVAVAYAKKDAETLNSLLTNSLVVSVAASLLILLVGYGGCGVMLDWLNIGANVDKVLLERAFLIAVAGGASMSVAYSLGAFNAGLQSSLGIGIISSAATLLSLVVTVVLLYGGYGLLALPAAVVVRGVGCNLGNLAYLVWRYKCEELRFSFSLKGLSSLMKLSSYTFLGQNASLIAANMDSFVVTRFLGAEIAPVYALTRKGPDLSRMVLERPTVAFMPAISNLFGSGDHAKAKAVLLRLMRIILWLLGLVSAGFLVFNSDFVDLWVGRSLFAGYPVNVVVVLALIVTVIVNALANLCLALGDIKGNNVARLAQSVFTIILIFAGAKYYGMLGIAAAPLVSSLGVLIWYYPRVFARLLKIDGADIRTVSREVLSVAGALTAAMGMFFWIDVKTWGVFTATVSAFSLFYSAVLACMSPMFRLEVKGVYDKILPAKGFPAPAIGRLK